MILQDFIAVVSLLASFVLEVVSELFLGFVLSVAEAFTKGLFHLFAAHVLEAALGEVARVLDEVSHVGHHERRDFVTVETVTIEQAHDLYLALLTLYDDEEAVLIWPILRTLLRYEFNILVRKDFLILLIEVLQDVPIVQQGLIIEEQELVFMLLLGVAQVVQPTGHDHIRRIHVVELIV